MKNADLFHCAEARVGRGPGDRGDDRAAAFARLVDAALEASADALLVAGQLVEPGRLDAAAIGPLEATLRRASAARLPVLVTLDGGADGWLGYLAERELIRPLLIAASPDAGADGLPEVVLADGTKVIGLGRPMSAGALTARLDRLPRPPRGVRQVALASIPEPVARSPEASAALLAAAGRCTYIACGGRRREAVVGDAVRDPGPLTRLDLDSIDEPGYLTISLRSRGVRIAKVEAEDRPLVIARLDATSDRKAAGLAKQLRERLASRRATRAPLLRLDLVTRDGVEPDAVNGEELTALATELLAPTQLELRITTEDDVLRPSGREPIERAVLDELTRERDAGFVALAASVFDGFGRQRADEADWIADEVQRYVDRSIDAPGGRRAPR